MLHLSSAHAAPVLRADDPQFALSIDRYIDIYLDESAQLSIDQILAPEIDRRFAPMVQQQAAFGFTDDLLWFRFTLRNDSSESASYSLQFLPVSANILNVWQIGSEQKKIFSLEEGSIYFKEGLAPGVEVPLGYLEPNESFEYYIQFGSHFPLNLMAKVYSARSLGIELSQQNSDFTMRFGALISLLVISFALLLHSRNVAFLFFSLHLLVLIAYLRTLWGYPTIWFEFDAQSSGLSLYLTGVCTVLFNILMVRRIVSDTAVWPRLKPWLNGGVVAALMGAALIAVAAVDIVPYEFAFYVYFCGHILMAIVCGGSSILVFTETRELHYVFFLMAFGLGILLINLAIVSALANIGPLQVATILVGTFAVLINLCTAIGLLIYAWHLYRRKVEEEKEIEFKAKLARNQSGLLSKLTHEILTPMSGVLGMSELLIGTQLDDKQRELARDLDLSAQELVRIIDDVTTFAHIQNNSLANKSEDFDLLELLDQTVMAYRHEAERRKAELVFYIEPGAPRHIRADPLRIRHLLGNLLSYSIASVYEGEVFVQVCFIQEEGQDKLSVTLRDDGLGLREQELERLFLDTEQFDNLIPQMGSIGLPLSKRIAEALGGSLKATSRPGFGTTFELLLPISLSAQAPVQVDLSALNNLRVLAVDDNSTCCEVIARQAAYWGTQVDCCYSGSEALAMLRAEERGYHVLIIDYAMAGMDGVQLIERIHADHHIANRDVKIIMLTGLSVAPETQRLAELGVLTVAQKPLSATKLQSLLLRATVTTTSPTLPDIEEPEPLRELSILVAEDDDITVQVMERMFQKLELPVIVVNNGEEALRAVQRQHFDLILMDCEMPQMNGFDATRLIREWEQEAERPRTVIVALTAHMIEQFEEGIRSAGMDAQIRKPLRINDLRKLVEQWVPDAPKLGAERL